MLDTSEKNFEATIEAALLEGGPDAVPGARGFAREGRVAYGEFGEPSAYRKRTPEEYDRARCLLRRDVLDFIWSTQPTIWDKLKRQHGDKVEERFLTRLAQQIETRGTLDVLRTGVVDLGCKFDLAYFRPETGLNEEHQRLHGANIFSIVRQLRYSQKHGNSLDLVLFVNGLPVVTAELKNRLSGQTVIDVVKQYQTDRDPKEPLFASTPRERCIAHFAVDTDKVWMTTQLAGQATRFLPFNHGRDNGAGNPVRPDNFKTAYLWEEVWQRESLLDILQHFSQVEKVLDDKGKETDERRLIFPRYHQLDAVRRLVVHARGLGAGQRYLIQHSAGSGKSNTIAWLAHRLAGLHDLNNERVFDTIFIVTDRRNLDQQLRGTIRGFEQVKGLVTAIETDKAKSLARALESGAQIVVTTLQTFPFIPQLLERAGRTFAVIVDEAHSSQSGEGTRSLKAALAAPNLAAAEQADSALDPDDEDEVNRAVEEMMRGRGPLPNVSFFAFTATPKGKTLELFGQRDENGAFVPFSLYSMRQAIEEGFILDVLRNYTTYKVYFGLLKSVEDDPNFDRKKAIRLLANYAHLHPHAFAEKCELVAEHFQAQVRNRIPDASGTGQAKAMLVTRSRLHAVRFKQAMNRYLKQAGYDWKALVAFSGTVVDPDNGLPYTEAGMNGFPESRTAEAFKRRENRLLIVANKFQTGFDQPLLHTMYVDKKLGGVNAVQTLSRLNRIHDNKDDTFVLDFANEAEEIQAAFQPYYEATLLSEPTDPNKLYDLKHAIEGYSLFGVGDIEAFAAIYFKPDGKQESLRATAKLNAVLDPVVTRYEKRMEDERNGFRGHVENYVRLYAFLGQVLTFVDADLEKFYQFTRHLLRKLPVEHDVLPLEVTQAINMDAYRIQQTSSGQIKLIAEDGTLKPIDAVGTAGPSEDDPAPLSEILTYVNEHYGTEFTDADKLSHFAGDMQRRLSDNDTLRTAMNPAVNPSPDTRRQAFDHFFNDTLQSMIGANFELYKKINDDPEFGSRFRDFVYHAFTASAP